MAILALASLGLLMADHVIHAAMYDPVMALADRAGLADERRRLVAEARGRVLEFGAGTGRNVPLYRDVERLTLIEPDGAMRRHLLDRVASAAVPVEVHETAIERSGLPDASYDTIVCSLVLCTVDEPQVALDEVRRMLRPGGQLLFLEHVRATGVRARVQRRMTPAWRRVAAGCHLDRDSLSAMRQAGFVITDCHRSGLLVRGRAKVRQASPRTTGGRAE